MNTALAMGPILCRLALLPRLQHIHASAGCVPRGNNKMEDAALRFTHIHNWLFLSHFHMHFTQSKTWCLLPIPSACRLQLTTMLHSKQYPRFFFHSVQERRHRLTPIAALLQLATNHLWTPRNQRHYPFPTYFSELIHAVLLYVQGNPIKKQSVEQHLRFIGQIFSSMEANNP